jgi:membrane protease YdiL (CAAX protease family)/tetratricopeptide (TPR) repeat protein
VKPIGFVLALLLFCGVAVAQQQFNPRLTAERNFAQCNRFFLTLKDPITAESYCNTAVQYAPENSDYLRLFSRVLLALGKNDEADRRLSEARAQGATNPEFDTIEAEIALAKNETSRAIDAATRVSNARVDVQVRALKAGGQALNRQSRFHESVDLFRRAVELAPADTQARRALAELHLRTDPTMAVTVLEAAPGVKSPPLLADLGRAQWIAGDLNSAITNLEPLLLQPEAFARDRDTYQKALGALAYAYFGQGRLTEGQRTLEQIEGQNNWFAVFIARTLPWLLALVLLLVLHLIGESRIEPLSTIEIQDGPRPWTVGTAYAWLLIAIIAGGVAALVTGNALYGNYLAILTPFQANTARDAFLIVMSLVLLLLSVQSAKANGWRVRSVLFGQPSQESIAEGIALGILLVGLTILYQFGTRYLGLTQYFTDASNLRISMLAVILILPLCEVFFRAFALFPLEKRYGTIIAACITALMFSLTLSAPLVLLFINGIALVFVADRSKSVTPAIAAHMTYLIGVFVAVALIPMVRNWF